jgi:cytochrome c556
MTGFSAALLAAAATVTAPPSFAGDKPSKAELEVDYRQGLYTVIGGNFGPLGAMAAGKAPFDAAEAKLRATRVAFLAPILKEAFPADSNGVGHTAAKPEIWTDKAGFEKALQAFIDSSAALSAAANGGDAEKIKAAIGETGKTCKACHDKYKAKD